ncbi:electron transfer flavoprotein-ubiquinone oxidoreductase [Thecamonas trahens ATCC 50062]|uniref:Electron transfer flavoprotein-ubiquinone oxidoreductase n=1 Tax=Thecamonas trahens ATCC 50062 TaxID=461836 RepID=A0A0L0DRE6_THETB|nr:electron transfer flavoprotein-ubiquinone oxidoreductase [Thecamonas trahens ATCC 50062]KNC54561.1 electron transfer flavoprotein-ubiquinone oxidoreductase [Thecamonas trahens ATCC 50062]|eukprot:XP_013753576.1 electron transfer flavoprotein-ubiquinone oxidoreductase [Thecamonas trahens ATCC 50062]
MGMGMGMGMFSTSAHVSDDGAEDEAFIDEVDVLIVGGGPAGLSAAIRAKQAFADAGQDDRRVLVLEKGAELGAHILSGNVFETRALDELIPDWKDKGAPLVTPAKDDSFVFLTSESSAITSPIVPPQMHNDGNYIISLGKLVRWLGEQAEELGVEVYPGYAGARVVYNDDGSVRGVATGDMGIAKDGSKKPDFMPGMELHAPVTLFAEGARGSMSLMVMDKFGLRDGVMPQSYGLGIKELWQVPDEIYQPGLIQHTIGWPLDTATYGGSFLYHQEDNTVAVGFVIGLDYPNPYLNPFREFQRFKHHPEVAKHLAGGERISYGARAINEGGLQAIPKLAFPGGALIGCSAGFLNVPKIKGTHTAMQSGMYAADAAVSALMAAGDDASSILASDAGGITLDNYVETIESSWVYDELRSVRNIRPGFQYGFWPGMANAAFETATFGKAPWTLTMKHEDHEARVTADNPAAKEIEYPKPDGVLSFDLPSSVFLANNSYEEDQPSHLHVHSQQTAVDDLNRFAGQAHRFCPAGVYTFMENESGPYLHTSPSNCVQCKCCSIVAPHYIEWRVPEGANGPLYSSM